MPIQVIWYMTEPPKVKILREMEAGISSKQSEHQQELFKMQATSARLQKEGETRPRPDFHFADVCYDAACDLVLSSLLQVTLRPLARSP